MVEIGGSLISNKKSNSLYITSFWNNLKLKLLINYIAAVSILTTLPSGHNKNSNLITEEDDNEQKSRSNIQSPYKKFKIQLQVKENVLHWNAFEVGNF